MKHKKKTTESEISECNDSVKYIIETMKEINVSMKETKIQLKSYQDQLEVIRKNRSCDEFGLDSLIGNVLGKNLNIFPQAYHGGDMNGVHCRKLISNIELIMEKVKVIAMKRLDERIINHKKQMNGDERDILTNVIDNYTNLFHVMDIVFSSLRILDPTAIEIEETKKANFVLENIWRNLNLSITPKAHILFVHAIDQFETLGGIAELVEDFIEKSHQEGKRLDSLTSRMSQHCYRQQQLHQIMKLWTLHHPKIESRIKAVHTFSKRNFKHPSSTGDYQLKIKKKARTEIRNLTKKEVIK